jgi:hypothetical protein
MIKHGCAVRVSYEWLDKVCHLSPENCSLQDVLGVLTPIIKWELFRQGGIYPPRYLNFEIERRISDHIYLIVVSYFPTRDETVNGLLRRTPEGCEFPVFAFPYPFSSGAQCQ